MVWTFEQKLGIVVGLVILFFFLKAIWDVGVSKND